MITVAELKRKSQALYRDYLRALVTEVPFFPRKIRSDKKVSEDFATMRSELAQIIAASAERTGYGYTIQYEKINTRKHGIQNLPMEISFETERDYLRFTGKQRESEVFKSDLEYILQTLPVLKDWCEENVLKIIEYAGAWEDIMKVCRYFLQHPFPGLYIRELPIEVHTKFIETHKALLYDLLNALLPSYAICEDYSGIKHFEERFGLKSSPALVRFRVLDAELARSCFSGLTDLSVPEEEFRQLCIPCSKIFILENKMNFLTLPQRKGAIGIWGCGFGVSILRECPWLKDKEIYYWGDLDVHGFQILSQCRLYYPQVQSVMMDKQTYQLFQEFSVENCVPNCPELGNLTDEERETWLLLQRQQRRLEQEKISHAYASEKLDGL